MLYILKQIHKVAYRSSFCTCFITPQKTTSLFFFTTIISLALAFVLNGLKAFDPVIEIENKYDINLKQISRTAKNKVLTYKVKPTSGKYKKVGFLIIKKGREQAIDDFDDNCLKYIIENIVDKELLQNFEKEETTTEYGMLEYNLIYTGDDEAKLQQLRDYILKYDWNISKIIDLNNKIK